MNVHALRGCSPDPLAHYLKALGVLRLVAEQADDSARGFWRDECFHLVTRLGREELLGFFLERYEPTPLVAPWNKGAGFFSANDPALTPVERSSSPRFGKLRHGLKAARELIDEISRADAEVRRIKDESKKGTKAEKQRIRSDPEYKRRLAAANRVFLDAKRGLIPRCRQVWRGAEREWLDAALVLGQDLTPVYPSLLGTGGNDGRLDFTNNYYQRLGDLFDFTSPAGVATAGANWWWDAALFGTPDARARTGLAVGQFLPGLAGGANASNAPDAESRVNPVDFVLALEGTLLFRGHLTRRLDSAEYSEAAAPFAIPARSAGYSTASSMEGIPRGEQWVPLWEAPLRVTELRQVFAEGRARIGSRPVREPLQFANAIARLGTARGITAFQRFAYAERNGQSNLAVSLGRFTVPDTASERARIVDVLESWLVRLARQARSPNAPARFRSAERTLGDAVLCVTQHLDEPLRWQRVLLALGDVEAIMASGTGFAAGPVPTLQPEWVSASDDGSPEFRLAVSLALQHGIDERGRRDGVRRHWLPLDESRQRFATTGDLTQKRLARRSDQVMFARDGKADAIALIERRCIEARQAGARQLPLLPAFGAAAHLSDIAALLAGRVDVDRLMALARALMAVDLRAWNKRPAALSVPTGSAYPDDSWIAIRLTLLPWPLDGKPIGFDPAIIRRLGVGDLCGAYELASRRLRAVGLDCPVRAPFSDPSAAGLQAAALAFPITSQTASALARRLDPSSAHGVES